MPHFALGHRLPHCLAAPLFGDRQQFGLNIQFDDPDWAQWQEIFPRCYQETQKSGPGNLVNHAGYQIMRQVPLAGKRVLEIGPGEIHHRPYWLDRPAFFQLADVRQQMLDRSLEILQAANIPAAGTLIAEESRGILPFEDQCFEIVLTYYSLEHLYPLEQYLSEMLRVLKPGGLLVGAIPCEGGLAWGAGRFVTSRNWLKRHTTLHPDKIICWEHPNFADLILNTLDTRLKRECLEFWPFRVPSIDLNLVARFIYQKHH